MTTDLTMLIDAYVDAYLALEDAVISPTPSGEEVIQYLRIATVIANHVSGITGEVYQC